MDSDDNNSILNETSGYSPELNYSDESNDYIDITSPSQSEPILNVDDLNGANLKECQNNQTLFNEIEDHFEMRENLLIQEDGEGDNLNKSKIEATVTISLLDSDDENEEKENSLNADIEESSELITDEIKKIISKGNCDNDSNVSFEECQPSTSNCNNYKRLRNLSVTSLLSDHSSSLKKLCTNIKSNIELIDLSDGDEEEQKEETKINKSKKTTHEIESVNLDDDDDGDGDECKISFISSTGNKSIYIPRKCSKISSKKINLISKYLNVNVEHVKNVINMIVDDCSVPFITRYRRRFIKSLTPDDVKKISDTFHEMKKVNEKIESIKSELKKENLWNEEIENEFSNCLTLDEFQKCYIYFSRQDSDACKAYNLGLEASAKMVMNGIQIDPFTFVKKHIFGIETVDKVKDCWKAIITNIITRDVQVFNFVSQQCKQYYKYISIEVELDEEIGEKMIREGKEESLNKYNNLCNKSESIDEIDSVTIFKVNRGEKEGLLQVYIVFNDEIEMNIKDYCLQKWTKCSPALINTCIYSAWDNFMKPAFAQYIRWQLTKKAENLALNVFRANVIHLLLEPPIRGKTILGVEPGFERGCKMAMVSPWGVPIAFAVIKLDTLPNRLLAVDELKEMLMNHECDLVAIGNGVGCRNFEDFLSSFNRQKFLPYHVNHKIVVESGIFNYSSSKEATEEFPDLPNNLITAVSIARRVQDPFSELVKLDPKRLDIGLYIKDLPDDLLSQTFDNIIKDCISYVGVDVNYASFPLLSKVSGIGPDLALKIIKYRKKNGPFMSRHQLQKIHAITSKQFQQFAGFIKVFPSTSRQVMRIREKWRKMCLNKYNNNNGYCEDGEIDDDDDDDEEEEEEEYNYLDCTNIHPESYEFAEKLINYIGAERKHVGKHEFIQLLDSIEKSYNNQELAVLINSDPFTIEAIVDALKRPLDYDVQIEKVKFCYENKAKSFEELEEGMHLRGRVINATPIGTFIDVGIDKRSTSFHYAYLPPNKSNQEPENSRIVIVQITKIDFHKKKFQVRLKRFI